MNEELTVESKFETGFDKSDHPAIVLRLGR